MIHKCCSVRRWPSWRRSPCSAPRGEVSCRLAGGPHPSPLISPGPCLPSVILTSLPRTTEAPRLPNPVEQSHGVDVLPDSGSGVWGAHGEDGCFLLCEAWELGQGDPEAKGTQVGSLLKALACPWAALAGQGLGSENAGPGEGCTRAQHRWDLTPEVQGLLGRDITGVHQGQGQGHTSKSQWKENVGFEGLQWLGAMCGKDTCHTDPQLKKHLPVSALEPQELNRVLKTRHSRLRSHQRTETLQAIRVGG